MYIGTVKPFLSFLLNYGKSLFLVYWPLNSLVPVKSSSLYEAMPIVTINIELVMPFCQSDKLKPINLSFKLS